MSNMLRGRPRGYTFAVVTSVLCSVLLLSSHSIAEDYYEGQAAIMADQSVISIRQDVWGLVFDPTCSSCKSSYPEWMFIGDLKVDSVILETGSIPLTQSTEMEQVSISNAALLSILKSTNTTRLMKYFPLEAQGDTLWWDPDRAVWKVLPDLSLHYYIEFDPVSTVQGVVDQLAAIPELLLAEPCAKPVSEGGDACDYGVTEWAPNDFPDQAAYAGYHLEESRVIGSSVYVGMNAECAWGLFSAGQRGNARIGIIESTPVCAEHSDLNAVNVGAAWEPGNTGHPTKSAGSAGAIGDNYPETGIKTIGVAPDAEIYGFFAVNLYQDMVSAASPDEYDCDVIHFPYSFKVPDMAMLVACSTVSAYEKPLVVTVGNLEDFDFIPTVTFPAAWDDLTISVGASNVSGRHHAGSNYAPQGQPSIVDFIAPGQSIITTAPPDGVSSWDGTSAAAALVTGVIALATSANPNLTPSQIESIIAETAVTAIIGYNVEQYGAGRVDAFEAIHQVFEECCQGKVGDVNGIGGDTPTIGDIALLIDHLFISGAPINCIKEADVNQSGGAQPAEDDLSIGDVSLLIDHLFISGTPLNDCL